METTTSYAASSTLAKQIEAAAPADIFISADLDWMDYLAKKNLIKAETRANLLGNQLVLIAPSSSTIDSGSRRISRSPRRSATVGWLSPIRMGCRPENTARLRCRRSASGLRSPVMALMAEWLHLSPEEATAVHLSLRVALWAMTRA